MDGPVRAGQDRRDTVRQGTLNSPQPLSRSTLTTEYRHLHEQNKYRKPQSEWKNHLTE